MFLSSLYVALRAKHKILADHRDVLSPDLFSHGSRTSTSRSDLLKLPMELVRTSEKLLTLKRSGHLINRCRLQQGRFQLSGRKSYVDSLLDLKCVLVGILIDKLDLLAIQIVP